MPALAETPTGGSGTVMFADMKCVAAPAPGAPRSACEPSAATATDVPYASPAPAGAAGVNAPLIVQPASPPRSKSYAAPAPAFSSGAPTINWSRVVPASATLFPNRPSGEPDGFVSAASCSPERRYWKTAPAPAAASGAPMTPRSPFSDTATLAPKLPAGAGEAITVESNQNGDSRPKWK